MAEEQLLARELAEAVGEKESRISFWARKGLLVFERINGRTRIFPAAENISRVRYIKQRQREPEGCLLNDIYDELNRGLHRGHQLKRPSGGRR